MEKLSAADIRADVAGRLRIARKSIGFRTARSFAKKLGIDENSYTPYERGKAIPPPVLLAKVKHLTGVTMDWLFFGDTSGLTLKVHEALQKAEMAKKEKQPNPKRHPT